jgi:hypothetical protein
MGCDSLIGSVCQRRSPGPRGEEAGAAGRLRAHSVSMAVSPRRPTPTTGIHDASFQATIDVALSALGTVGPSPNAMG